VIANACSILGSGVTISWYDLSSCDIIAGWCWRGLRRTWGNGTLGDGCHGLFCSCVSVSVDNLGDCVCGVGWLVVVVTVGTLGVNPGGEYCC
jgi:hypothetical protein